MGIKTIGRMMAFVSWFFLLTEKIKNHTEALTVNSVA